MKSGNIPKSKAASVRSTSTEVGQSLQERLHAAQVPSTTRMNPNSTLSNLQQAGYDVTHGSTTTTNWAAIDQDELACALCDVPLPACCTSEKDHSRGILDPLKRPNAGTDRTPRKDVRRTPEKALRSSSFKRLLVEVLF